MAILVAIPFFLAYFIFGKSMIQLFMSQESALALDTGIQFLRIVSPFYFVICIKLMADGVLRGSENMNQFMISTFMDLILRVILAFIMSDSLGTKGIWLSWPIGWTVSMLLSTIFYHRLKGIRRKE